MVKHAEHLRMFSAVVGCVALAAALNNKSVPSEGLYYLSPHQPVVVTQHVHRH